MSHTQSARQVPLSAKFHSRTLGLELPERSLLPQIRFPVEMTQQL